MLVAIAADAYNHAIVVPLSNAIADVVNGFIKRYNIGYIRDGRSYQIRIHDK